MEKRNIDGLSEKEFLKQYDDSEYEKPSVTADMVLFTMSEKESSTKQLSNKDLKLLLIKRKDHPCINSWALPGGFVNMKENLSVGAYRELKEETNIEDVYLEQLYTWGDVERDPRTRVISVAYMGLVPLDGMHPIAGDDALEVALFTVEKTLVSTSEKESVYNLIFSNKELNITILYLVIEKYVKNGFMNTIETTIQPLHSNESLAFDHAKIINLAINRLRTKIEYSPLAINLLGEKFTLGELQTVYEIILGRKLHKSNFRKKVEKMVEELQEEEPKSVGHRPAKYYTLRKDARI